MTQPNKISLNRRNVLAGSMGLSLAAMTNATAKTTPKRWKELEATVNTLIDERLIPGMSVAVFKKGAFVYSKGFGLANIETATPVTEKSVFRIGSVTKQFTGVALLALQEDGLLSLDDTLDKYFPNFPRGNEITIHQMAAHTSGLGNYTARESMHDFMQASRPDYDHEDLLAAMRETDPLFIAEPGTIWSL